MEDQPVGNETKSETNARRLVYFSAERTLMAWIRASLGLMALGFVIDRFDLVVRHLMTQFNDALYPNTFSVWGGTLLALSGTLMAVTAAVRYMIFAIGYHRAKRTKPGYGLFMGVGFAVLVALMGIVIALSLAAVTRG